MVQPELARPKRSGSVFWQETYGEARKNRWFWWVSGFVFVLVAAGLFFVIFGSPSTLFRPQTAEIKIEGASEIKSGDRVSWRVKITNSSGAALEDAVLIFNFPEGASPVVGPKPEGIFRERKSIGKVSPGESVAEDFDAYVFGGRGTEKEVSAVLEYRPAGASAVFATDASFKFSIVRAPVAVSFNLPSDLRIGQEVDFEISYVSQADQILNNLSLKIDFPDGFDLISVSPNPTAQNKNVWNIGDLASAATGRIKIKGRVRGADLESKVFKAALGVFDVAKNSILPYDESSQTVILRAPFLAVNISANGSSEYITFPGDTISFDVALRNNLPEEIKNASLELKIEGSAVDFSSLRVDRGAFSEASGSIVWNASTYKPFAVLLPDQEEHVAFSFKTKSSLPLSSETPRPIIKIGAVFKPAAPVAGFEGVDVSGSGSYEIKVSSKLQVVSRALYYNSIIQNTGPLPPKVGEETTYAVIWSLANMVNDLSGVVVKSSLPPYMSFKNVVQPADADISFDKASGEIIWRAGRVLAGTGFLRPAPQVAFQIGLTPSQNQIGEAPLLINAVEASGRDTFTDQTLTSRDDQISTDLPDDPNITFNQKKVVQ